MQLRHISPRSSDWMDAMDEVAKGRDWESLAPEEQRKLRVGAQVAGTWGLRQAADGEGEEPDA